MTVLTPSYLQTKGYSAKSDRQLLSTLMQEGVVAAGDLLVTAGGGMTVNVASGDCFVQGDSITQQGKYFVKNDATINKVVGTAHATLPRIDQIILHVYDSTSTGGGTDVGLVEVLAGTATGGATLDNRTGAASLTASAVRLADVLVPAASASVTTPDIRDRRPWARGVHGFFTLTSGTWTPSTTLALLDTTTEKRYEFSGVPISVSLSFGWTQSSSLGAIVAPWVDSAVYAVGDGGGAVFQSGPSGSATFSSVLRAITPGSHTLGIAAANGSGTGTLTVDAAIARATTTDPVRVAIRELIPQSANNSS